MMSYQINPDCIPIVMQWLTPDDDDECRGLKHQARLLIERGLALEARLADDKLARDIAMGAPTMESVEASVLAISAYRAALRGDK